MFKSQQKQKAEVKQESMTACFHVRPAGISLNASCDLDCRSFKEFAAQCPICDHVTNDNNPIKQWSCGDGKRILEFDVDIERRGKDWQKYSSDFTDKMKHVCMSCKHNRMR